MYSAELISISHPSKKMQEEHGAQCAEDIIAYCARVSNPSNQANFDTAQKLLEYCMEKEHWSIFEMANAVIEVTLTRDIGRQVLRHRSFAFQEFSTRYAKIDVNEWVLRQARLQDPKNRQASIPCDDHTVSVEWAGRQEEVWEAAVNAYEWALHNGIAKEQARAVLPEGLTPSTMYMNGTIRSWIHYCLLRMANGTQLEHQWIAKSCWGILRKEFEFMDGIIL